MRKLVCLLALFAIATIGCDSQDVRTVTNEDGSVSTIATDSDEDVIDAATPLGGECCDLLIPFARAIEKGDYEAAYDAVDPMVFDDVHARQFLRISPRREVSPNMGFPYVGDADDRIGAVDKATFVKVMKDEESLGKPLKLTDVIEDFSLEDADGPLSKMDGRYPEGFPFASVVGTVTIHIDCQTTSDMKEALAKRFECEADDIYGDCYMTIFAMVVESDGVKKIAYIDFKDMRLDD